MEYKEQLKQRARCWSKKGTLTVYLCRQLFNRSDSCIRKWVQQGKLSRLKEGPEGSKAPVRIKLASVLAYIETFDED
jgi:hypothetical protein